MTTTLSEGVKVPDVGSVNWAGDLEVNWNLLNGALANLSGNVKTDRDNTWTGVQSFTLPIVGSITGTAAKAIADEDGTSIKTGYVNVAGNQTVTGQKTWSGTQYYNGMMTLQASSDVMEQFRQKLPKDVSTSTDPLVRFNTLVDSAGHNVVINAEGHWETYVSKSVTLKYKNDDTKAGIVDFRLGSNGKGILYPQSPFECSLGNSTNQWSSVYAQTYYYNGTAWGLDKDNTWSGTQYFSKNLILTRNVDAGTIPSSSVNAGFKFENANATYQFVGVTGEVNTDGTTFVYLTATNKFSNGALDPNGTSASRGMQIGIRSDGTGFIYTDCRWRNSLEPHSVDSGFLDLGTSTNKWKTLNGVNPGALSLPDASNAVALDTTNVSMDGTYTYLSVSVNGWLYVALKDTTCKTDGELTFYIGDSGTSSAYAKWAVNFVCSTDGYVRCFIPVLANSRIRVRVNPNGGSPTGLTMTIYPCLGNV